MYQLTLTVEGATHGEIQRGLYAAKAVFDKAGVHPMDAAGGMWEMEGWDDGGFVGELSDEDADHAHVWIEAEVAAIKACCEGWDEDRPRRGSLEIEELEQVDPPISR